MATTKMYGLSGVSTNIELGKAGYQVEFNGSDAVSILQSDGVTLGVLKVAEPSVNSDASTKFYVDTQISNLIDSSPDTLNTLNEIAQALNDDPDFYTTITNMINLKADSTTVDEIDANVDDLITLSGEAENASAHTNFTGTIIRDTPTTREALQDLETAVDAINADTSGHVHSTITKDSTSPADIGTTDVPINSVIESVKVNVTEAWGAGATMELGYAGSTDIWGASSEIDLTTVGQYDISPLVAELGSAQRAIATLNHNASATGSAFVFIKYC